MQNQLRSTTTAKSQTNAPERMMVLAHDSPLDRIQITHSASASAPSVSPRSTSRFLVPSQSR